jgi:hypothetical protein
MFTGMHAYHKMKIMDLMRVSASKRRARNVGLAWTIFIYGVYTVFLAGKSPIYGHIRCMYTVLANPKDMHQRIFECQHMPAHTHG